MKNSYTTSDDRKAAALAAQRVGQPDMPATVDHLKAEVAALKSAEHGKSLQGLLASAERASIILRSVHERLHREGNTELAPLVWVAFLETTQSAERLGEWLGVEPELGA